MTEQNRLSSFGTGTRVEGDVFQCRVCGYSSGEERKLYSHINSYAGDTHPEWSDLPVNKKVENGGCYDWKVEPESDHDFTFTQS